jgi:hypothetical protein
VKVCTTYTITVEEHGDGTCVARIGDEDTPLRGAGETPILAIAALAETLREWPLGGSDRWLNTPAGTRLARQFCPDFEPDKPGASS